MADRLHIAHVVPSLDRTEGGLPAAVVGLVDHLAREGVRNTLVSSVCSAARSDAYWPAEASVDLRVLRGLNVRSLRQLAEGGFAGALGKLSEPPDVLHAHGVWIPQTVWAVRWAVPQGIPVVLSPHGMLTTWSVRHQRWKKRLAWYLYQKRALRSATVIHATAEDEASDVRAFARCRDICVIPNGIEIPPAPADARRLAGARTIGFLGRLHPKKGVAELLRGWAKVQREGGRLLIAGPDENGYRNELEALVRELGLAHSVEFLGLLNAEERAQFFARLSVFVLPSFSENFGLVVPEALAAGVPCIASLGTPWSEMVNQRCGWWVENTPESLAEVLRSVMETDSAALCAMGRRGRAWVEDAFGWGSVARRYVGLYTRVAAREV